MDDAKSFSPGLYEPVLKVGTNLDPTYEAFDLNFDGNVDFYSEVGVQTFSDAVGVSGAREFNLEHVSTDFKMQSHYLNCRSMFEVVSNVEGRHMKLTTPITKPTITVIEPLAKAQSQFGQFEHQGVSYCPRDPEMLAIEQLMYCCKYAADSRATTFTGDVRPGNVDHIDFRYLKFNSNGMLEDNRECPLSVKVKKLIAWLSADNNVPDIGAALGLIRRVSEVSTALHLSIVEEDLILSGYLTRQALNTLYGRLPEHPNNNMQTAIRQIFGIADWTYGHVIQLNAIRPRLDVVARSFRKVEAVLKPVFKFVSLPKYDGGTAVQLVSSDAQLGTLRSEVPQTVSGVAMGILLYPMDYGPRRQSVSIPTTRYDIVSRVVAAAKL